MTTISGAAISCLRRVVRRIGSILGLGTVSNEDAARGFSCIAEKRALETLADGQPSTPYLRFGDRVRIELIDALGQSVFGAIDQQAVRARP